MTFLGHVISEGRVETDPSNTEKVARYPEPTNKTQLRGFLGLTGYYRRFIEGYATLAEPLNRLLRNKEPYEWRTGQEQAFNTLKTRLTTKPILIRPNFDQRFVPHTDASDFGLGAVLAQEVAGKREGAVAYLSRSLTQAERNYDTTEREALAVVWAVKKLRHYLIGVDFELVTDHKALKWLFNRADPEGKLARWITTLQNYTFTITHRSGATHLNADALSRIPPQLTSVQQPTSHNSEFRI